MLSSFNASSPFLLNMKNLNLMAYFVFPMILVLLCICSQRSPALAVLSFRLSKPFLSFKMNENAYSFLYPSSPGVTLPSYDLQRYQTVMFKWQIFCGGTFFCYFLELFLKIYLCVCVGGCISIVHVYYLQSLSYTLSTQLVCKSTWGRICHYSFYPHVHLEQFLANDSCSSRDYSCNKIISEIDRTYTLIDKVYTCTSINWLIKYWWSPIS